MSDPEVKDVVFHMFVGEGDGSIGAPEKHSIAVNEGGIVFLSTASEWNAGHYDYAFHVTADDLERLATRCASAAKRVRAREKYVTLLKFWRMCRDASLVVYYVPSGPTTWDFQRADYLKDAQEARDLGENEELLNTGFVFASRDTSIGANGPNAVQGAWSEACWFLGQRNFSVDDAYAEVQRG